jgi:hypothetical protein
MEREAGLKVVDGFDLDADIRAVLRPHEMVQDKQGRQHRLPRYFYEVPSHEAARDIRLTSHFGLNEFLLVDLKEAQRLRQYPRYVPCAIRTLAFYLERLREVADDWYVMPYGHEIGKADDHLHLDLGYVMVVPREISEDRLEAPQAVPRHAFEERRSGDRRGWPSATTLELPPAATTSER